jgi:hypothetical protein
LETITIFLGFDSFVDDAVVGWMESHQILLRSLLVSLSEQFWVLFFFWYI